MEEASLPIVLLRGLIGLAVLLGLTWLLSEKRKAIPWRVVAAGLGLQVVLGMLALWVPGVSGALDWISARFVEMLGFGFEGGNLLFGPLMRDESGAVLAAFSILCTIIFFSSLTALLYYLGILQWIVFGIAWVMQRTMRLSGPECLSAAANIFVGMTEAPLVVRPYLATLTRSEMMALMTGGMATIAGSMMAVYVTILGGGDLAAQTAVAKMLLTASIMNAPASLFIAKMMIPQESAVRKDLMVPKEDIGDNVLDAITHGASDGLKLALNVVAMIIAFYGLIYLANWVLGGVGSGVGADRFMAWISGGQYEDFSIQSIAAFVFAPIAWAIGVDRGEILLVGEMIGTKLCFNEFLGYLRLSQEGGNLSPRTVFITTFALCGFANFGSIGIMIGGISALEPGKRKELVALGFKAMLGGAIASLISATIAGVLYR